MKLLVSLLVLLAAGLHLISALDSFSVANLTLSAEHSIIKQSDYDDWVYPDVLPAMPQCIAQQNDSPWLKAMTECSWKRCTRHFWFICTQHKWFVSTSCLGTVLSPNMLSRYSAYCRRSILAKAQLYQWIQSVTGRLFLVTPGDTRDVYSLSHASLRQGYAAVSTADKAPSCLLNAESYPAGDSFEGIMTSCSFERTSRHKGNAERPWEYREDSNSIVALDVETVGYDLIPRSPWSRMWDDMQDVQYFDKACFCHTFDLDLAAEPCAAPNSLDMAKERLWMAATCGQWSLPRGWKTGLKMTGYWYIPFEEWRWPACFEHVPSSILGLRGHCSTEACEVDAHGYCQVKRTIDRECFCQGISYDSCNGSCHVLDGRIDYVNWLRETCSGVADWNGLPDDWRRLMVPTTLEMIPWQWKLEPAEPSGSARPCALKQNKVYSLVLINICTIFAMFCVRRFRPGLLYYSPHPWCWIAPGVSIAALQLLASLFNTLSINTLPEYADAPLFGPMMLWWTMPRPVWVVMWYLSTRPVARATLSATASVLLSEAILQCFASCYLLWTVSHGLDHGFYFGGIGTAKRGQWANMMYVGALLWLLTMGVAIVVMMRALSSEQDSAARKASDSKSSSAKFQHAFAQSSSWDGSQGKGVSEDTFLTASNGPYHTSYGTLPVDAEVVWVSREAFFTPYMSVIVVTFSLWLAQWGFWGGYIALSSEIFCPPNLGLLTGIWIAASVAGVAVAMP